MSRLFQQPACTPQFQQPAAVLGHRWLDQHSFNTEDDLAAYALAGLQEDFTAEREVWGTHCSGARLRLDAILRPRIPDAWHDPHPAFGLEFKRPLPSQGFKALTRWAAQCIDYAHTTWDRHGQVAIFTCPGVTDAFPSDRDTAWMTRLLGQFCVGELRQDDRHGWALYMSASRVWSQADGVGQRRTLMPKVGSR